MNMKALIVDDEDHVRDAIRMLLPWDELGFSAVYEARDGMEAIVTIQRERPDLIFTDIMMPATNGLQLLEWVQRHAPDSKTIVISGYSDFEFVRQSMKHGGLDYILKPVDPDELLEATRKAIRSLQEERERLLSEQKRNIEMNRLKSVYWNKVFSDLLEEPRTFSSVAGLLQEEFGLDRPASDAQVAILHVEAADREGGGPFGADRDLLFFAITNICNDFLRHRGEGYAFRYWNSDSEVVLLFWRGFDHVGKRLADIHEALLRVIRTPFHIGVGTVRPFPAELPQSCREARQALRQRNLLQQDRWIHPFAKTPAPIPPVHFTETEDHLRMALRTRNPQLAASAIRSWIDKIKRLDHITPEQIELWWKEYQVFRAQLVHDLVVQEGQDVRVPEADRPAIPVDAHGRFSAEMWGNALLDDFLLLLESMQRNGMRAEHSIVSEIKKYVETHYDRELTLQDIARHFYLSREYISRKFKQETGENLSDYIARVRIDKARLLLANPAAKISDVAQWVGFRDEKYFSKVFKKFQGMTPGEYRKRHQAASRPT